MHVANSLASEIGHIDDHAQCRACGIDQPGVLVIGNIAVTLFFAEAWYRCDLICGSLAGEYTVIENHFQHQTGSHRSYTIHDH